MRDCAAGLSALRYTSFEGQPHPLAGALTCNGAQHSCVPICCALRHFFQENDLMLWTITIVLVILWLVGFIGFPVLGSWIHLLLVIALIVLIFNLLSGRRGI